MTDRTPLEKFFNLGDNIPIDNNDLAGDAPIIHKAKKLQSRKPGVHKGIPIVKPTKEERAKGFIAGKGKVEKGYDHSVKEISQVLGTITTADLRKAAAKHLKNPFEVMLFQTLQNLKDDADQGVNVKEYLKMLEIVAKLIVKPASDAEKEKHDTDEKRSKLRDNIRRNLGERLDENGNLVQAPMVLSNVKITDIQSRLKNRPLLQSNDNGLYE